MELVPKHIKNPLASSVIEDEGEKFYLPLVKKESNNLLNYSDLDAVRQILVSPDLIASLPRRAIAAVNPKSSPAKASNSVQVYSPLIKDELSSRLAKDVRAIEAKPETDDNATIKLESLDILNKTEKALKYEEMKISSLKTTASQLYNHTYTDVPVEEYMTVLCDPLNPEAKKLRSLYLRLFLWNALLLDLLRVLCHKLYFRGESQNISRIIELFSIVWTQQFPKNMFGNQYAVYLIAYLLILLNLDLHLPELSKHILKDLFVKNTLNALKTEKLYPKDLVAALSCLRGYYESIETHELKLLGAQEDPANTSLGSAYSHANSSFVNLRKTSFNVSRSTRSTSALKMYRHDNGTGGLKEPEIEQPVGFLHALQRGTSQLRAHKSAASLASATSGGTTDTLGTGFKAASRAESITESQPIPEEDETESELALAGPPWAKEGMLRLKRLERPKNFFGLGSKPGLANSHSAPRLFSESSHLTRTLTNTSVQRTQKQNQPNGLLRWKMNFTVVSQGELKLFSFGTKGSLAGFVNSPHDGGGLRKKFSRLRLDKGEEQSSGVGDGNWMRNASSAGLFNLVATYLKIVPDDSLNNRSVKLKELETFWALKLPSNYDFNSENRYLPLKVRKETLGCIGHDNILMFSAGTREIAEEYVFTCNYWAARTTAIPTQSESVSNKNYGWGSLLDATSVNDVLKARIHPWEPLIPSVVASSLSMKKQLIELFKYVQILENLILEHLQLKDKIDEFIHRILLENQRHLAQLNRVFTLVLGNWNNKYNYLVNEHNQFKDYVLTLKEAIDLKQKAEE